MLVSLCLRLANTGCSISISESNLNRIITVISHSHALSIQETYGLGLLVFHMFCDLCGVPEEQRCLASSVLLLAFITLCIGIYSGKTLANYFYGIQAWHPLHSQPWLAQQGEIMLALEDIKHLTPPTSKHPK